MTARHLDQLEETVTSLAAYLLVAPRVHPKQLLGTPTVPQTTTSTWRVRLRLTQHYSAALLAYGFPVTVPELQAAIDWFSTPFGAQDQIDEVEMTRLEGLLNLRPDDLGVGLRIRQLVRQRDSMFFIIDPSDSGSSRDMVFDTLWALKLIILAKQRGVQMTMRGLGERELTRNLSELIARCAQDKQDKDLALALRLYYELSGRLESAHVGALEGLLERAKETGYLWGIGGQHRLERVRPILSAMERCMLTPNVIGKQTRQFRDIILNTCYVLENLSYLAHVDPEVERTLQASMLLWWNQFKGEKSPETLHAYFSEEYDYLMILSRTMVTVSAFVGAPLAAQAWQRPLREMARSRFNGDSAPYLEDIKLALRRWIGIELEEISELKLGLSEASVIRVRPNVYNPTDTHKRNLLDVSSLIVKSGPLADIAKERRHYRMLPRRAKRFFVRIPRQTSYINRAQHGYVIMEDLRDFYTLFETFDMLLRPPDPILGHLLGQFLIDLHGADGTSRGRATINHIRELYLLPMLRHVEFIAHQVQVIEGLLGERVSAFDDVEQSLNRWIGAIMSQSHRLVGFPLLLMHGDLHSRNIMIRVIQGNRSTGQKTDLRIKLIDLENLRADGDAAHDAGQLLVDLKLLPTSSRKNPSRAILEKLDLLHDGLRDRYLAFAQQQGDLTFPIRLDLARARALLRIAKGQTKRSERFLKERDFTRALSDAAETRHLVEGACAYLELAGTALQA